MRTTDEQIAKRHRELARDTVSQLTGRVGQTLGDPIRAVVVDRPTNVGPPSTVRCREMLREFRVARRIFDFRDELLKRLEVSAWKWRRDRAISGPRSTELLEHNDDH